MPELAAYEENRGPDLERLLDQELGRLPEKYRLPIILCHLEGRTRARKPHSNSAGPEGTVAGRLARAASTLLARRMTQDGRPLTNDSLVAILSGTSACALVPAPLFLSAVKAGTGAVSSEVARLDRGSIEGHVINQTESRRGRGGRHDMSGRRGRPLVRAVRLFRSTGKAEGERFRASTTGQGEPQESALPTGRLGCLRNKGSRRAGQGGQWSRGRLAGRVLHARQHQILRPQVPDRRGKDQTDHGVFPGRSLPVHQRVRAAADGRQTAPSSSIRTRTPKPLS